MAKSSASLLDDAPVLRSEGRMYPVAMRWGRPFVPGEFIEPRVVQTVLDAIHDESGSVLVFLPGQAEIRRVTQQLADALGQRSDIALCPLHGELDLAAQRAAIDPAQVAQRNHQRQRNQLRQGHHQHHRPINQEADRKQRDHVDGRVARRVEPVNQCRF